MSVGNYGRCPTGGDGKVIGSPRASSVEGAACTAPAAVSTADVWAVGDAGGNGQALIEQWNGTSWSVVPSPDPSASENTLNAAAADPSSGQAWAVGEFFNNISNVRQTLTEFNP